MLNAGTSLLLGTRNPGKIHEIKLILGDVALGLCSLNDFPDVAVAIEDAATYAENAILKARFYARATGLPVLADDSGLEVDALGGAPGVLSARYAGADATDSDRRTLLLSELAKVSELAKDGDENRRARFVCAIAIASVDGQVLNLSEGICEGTITFAPRGTSGFGYDPLFVPDGYDQTFAELSDEIKNQISHRARALIKLREFLNHEWRRLSA
ncbi:MAG TPA: RdgB/HAM1 family non-canonical purine NTP pyrophosphatase [Pyrinomonadaceae bacterium]|nr:RdgB/HAM1 family non-canonical purine NTP pyrophosphatase [Pyrinomonadaceae bacterium]